MADPPGNGGAGGPEGGQPIDPAAAPAQQTEPAGDAEMEDQHEDSPELASALRSAMDKLASREEQLAASQAENAALAAEIARLRAQPSASELQRRTEMPTGSPLEVSMEGTEEARQTAAAAGGQEVRPGADKTQTAAATPAATAGTGTTQAATPVPVTTAGNSAQEDGGAQDAQRAAGTPAIGLQSGADAARTPTVIRPESALLNRARQMGLLTSAPSSPISAFPGFPTNPVTLRPAVLNTQSTGPGLEKSVETQRALVQRLQKQLAASQKQLAASEKSLREQTGSAGQTPGSMTNSAGTSGGAGPSAKPPLMDPNLPTAEQAQLNLAMGTLDKTNKARLGQGWDQNMGMPAHETELPGIGITITPELDEGERDGLRAVAPVPQIQMLYRAKTLPAPPVGGSWFNWFVGSAHLIIPEKYRAAYTNPNHSPDPPPNPAELGKTSMQVAPFDGSEGPAKAALWMCTLLTLLTNFRQPLNLALLVVLVMRAMKGRANIWLAQVQQAGNVHTVHQLVDAFGEMWCAEVRYLPQKSRAMLAAGKISQREKETVHAYCNRLQPVMCDALNVSESEAIHYFLTGLRPDLHQMVATDLNGAAWTNLNACINFTVGQEQRLTRAASVRRVYTASVQKNQGWQQVRPKRERGSSPAGSTDRQAGGKKGKMGQQGKSAQPSKLIQKLQQLLKDGKGEEPNAKHPKLTNKVVLQRMQAGQCMKCGLHGHIAPNCQQQQQ